MFGETGHKAQHSEEFKSKCLSSDIDSKSLNYLLEMGLKI